MNRSTAEHRHLLIKPHHAVEISNDFRILATQFDDPEYSQFPMAIADEIFRWFSNGCRNRNGERAVALFMDIWSEVTSDGMMEFEVSFN